MWRTRAELPPCIAAHVPADVDFSREMIAGRLPPYAGVVRLQAPALPVRRERSWIVIEEQAAFEPCPPCRGVADREQVQRSPTERPLVLWRIPLVKGVPVFHVLRPAPGAGPCPPPTCA